MIKVKFFRFRIIKKKKKRAFDNRAFIKRVTTSDSSLTLTKWSRKPLEMFSAFSADRNLIKRRRSCAAACGGHFQHRYKDN